MPPLSGTHVVSMALNVPGPVAAQRLRRSGATIIKVEPPTGDPLEQICPSWYSEIHEDVEVARLDLKSPEGRMRMRALVSDAHLFLSSQRPSALARLELDHRSLAAHPQTARTRVLNIVGDRSRPDVAGHDLTYVAEAGLLGHDLPRTLVADLVGAERVFSSALLLLRDAEGTHVEVGLADGLDLLVAPLRHGVTAPGGTLGGGLPAYGIYDARVGRVAVAALEPHFRERLYRGLERPLDGSLTDAFLGRTADEWEAWGRRHDVPISVVND